MDGLQTSTPTLLEGMKQKKFGHVWNSKHVCKSRRKRSWTSLKEIAESKDHDNSEVANLKIPFF